jgi:RimJ/RimL family protein N-acetyltransferase
MLPCCFDGGLLRRLAPADLPAFQAYRGIPGLGRYQGWSPMSDAEAGAFLAGMAEASLLAPGEWVQLGIAETAAGRLVGDIGLCLDTDSRTAEIGFTLAPSHQGRGIATAAVRAAARLVFGATPAERILGITDVRNAPSVRLLQRAGFRHAESRDTVFRGEPCREAVYVLARAGD